MLPDLLLAMTIWTHPHDGVVDFRSRVHVRQGHVRDWQWQVRTDRFTDKVSCRLNTKRMNVHDQTVVFNVRRGADTTHATFRIDTIAARPVSAVFAPVQKHGIFPERGWIDDRAGGEVALPLEMVDGALDIAIRPSPRALIRVYDVRYIGDALAALKAAGCPDGAL
jgi:hypothetical protein